VRYSEDNVLQREQNECAPELQIRMLRSRLHPGRESFWASALTYGFDTAKRGTRRLFETSTPLSKSQTRRRHEICEVTARIRGLGTSLVLG
jgi:hypothetical protein